MGYARYVGRVGALAVALGVGTAVAGSAGTAWAEPADQAATAPAAESESGPADPPSMATDSEPSAPSESSEHTTEPAAETAASETQGSTQSRVEVAPGVVVSHSGGRERSTYGSKSNDSAPVVDSKKPSTVKVTPAPEAEPVRAIVTRSASPNPSTPAAPAVAPIPATVTPVVAPTTDVVAAPRAAVAAAPVTTFVWSALAAIFGSGSGPAAPAQTPVTWVMVAAARRELGTTDTAPAMSVARVAAVAAANLPPGDPVVTVGSPNPSTGVVTGTVVSTDPDGNPVTYSVPATTTKGSVSITSAGAFTYTPTAAARHAAAAVGATTATQDTFTVTVSDGAGGTTTKAVTVPVLGRNTVPTGYANVGWPNTTTGVVTGSISAGDADYDPLTYSAANTLKGNVSITSTGAWTYTPTAAARHAAAAVGAPAAAKQDTFTVSVSDGYGGTAAIPVTVSIVAKNTAPTNPTAVMGNPNPSTGVVTGTVGAIDADGDTLSYAAPATTSKGAVTITGTGAVTYTPTAAARAAAAAVNAPAAAKTDTFTVTITDGYGGSTTKAVTVTVAPRLNQAPGSPTVSVGNPNASTGVVTGAVVSVDPDGDTVAYAVPATTSKGSVSITSAGGFTYTPTATARHAAAAVGATTAKQDTFTVTMSDGYGGVTTQAVTVNILGRNTVPGGYANVGWPNTTTGVVTGTISASDADYDRLTYSAGNTAKGSVAITTTGAWTYTPTAAARHAAAAPGAPAAAKQDTFTVSVSDGYGGTATVPVTVSIVGSNSAPVNPTATVGNPSSDGVVTGTVGATDADGDTLSYVTPATTAKGAVAITSTGAFTYTPTAAARRAAAAVNAPATAKTDSFTATIADGYGGSTTKLVTVAVAPRPNGAPSDPTVSVGNPNASTGVVTGTVVSTDPEGDTLTYSVPASTGKGSVSITSAGTFTYTPTAAARHAAAAVGATTAKQDTFTVTVTDGYGGSTTKAVTVTVLGRNTAPTGYANVGWPNTTTGVVTGTISVGDNDYDALSYSAANTAKGSVAITSTGAWTYTPTAAARHAAAATNAPAAAKQDTFTVSVSDGYGGTAAIPVTVTIVGSNVAPTNAAAMVSNTHLRTGVVTGSVSATDADGDGLTYTSTASSRGALAIGANGTFTYTPTAAARQAATAANAPASARQDTFTITMTDGYGGSTQAVLTVAVTPYGANSPLTQVSSSVGQPNSAIGAVQGTVSAVDPEGDALTYAVTSGPTRGSVDIDAATGAFTYTPTTQARYDATVRPGQVVDSFTVTVSDAYGASISTTVGAVPVAAYDAYAIDQRPTSVGVSDPYLFFASQAETDEILDRLQAAGIDTVRIHVPWANVEPADDVYDWSAIDRMVDSARARNMTVLATLNHTPEWAVTPGQPALSGAPADPQQYADFAGAVATRYEGRISAYEIWNEPNANFFWAPEPSPAQYTELLKLAYVAIKAADPDATVVAGSVGFIEDNPGVTIDAVRYVREMYDNCAAGYFDALAFHPYHYWSPFSVDDPEQIYPRAQLDQIHQLMVANGDGEKVVWATEYGQTTLVGGEAQQAAFLADFLRTWRDIPYAGPAYLYTTRDGVGYSELENSFGLYREDWTPKPALEAVEEVIDENDAADARNL